MRPAPRGAAMSKRTWASILAKAMARNLAAARRSTVSAAKRATKRATNQATKKAAKPATGAGDGVPGVSAGIAGRRRFRLYRPPGIGKDERLPLLVMLHGCGQDALGLAHSTRMNRVAARERFLVLYPEQDRLANAQACWNWFDTASGRAFREVDAIMAVIHQVCLLHPVDGHRVAIAGMSAGASMAALVATRHPSQFKSVAMHSGVPPGSAHSAVTALRAMQGRRAGLAHAVASLEPGVPWPPLLVIQGTTDPVVDHRNADAAVRLWVDAAGAAAVLAGSERRLQRGKRRAMTVQDFKLRGRTVATRVDVAQLGHAWSGGASKQAFSDPLGPDASRMVWSFAARQFRAAGL